MKTIGILGGLGPESTITYYTYIIRKYYELCGNYAYPEILIHSFSFEEFIKAGNQLPQRVKGAIENLHHSGADFVVAACNSIHIVYDEVAADIPIPWINIVDTVGECIEKRSIHKVALLGTVLTMANDFYQKRLSRFGLETVVPTPPDQQIINKILFDELVRAEIKEESRQTVLGIIDKLAQDGIEGVVLGCTELPFLIRQEDTALPVFDTTVIHAQKALDLAMA